MQVLENLQAATRLLVAGDPATLEQSETHLRAALKGLPLLDSPELVEIEGYYRRVAGLVASANEMYRGLAGIMSVQAVGYGAVGAKAPVGTGRRFIIEG